MAKTLFLSGELGLKASYGLRVDIHQKNGVIHTPNCAEKPFSFKEKKPWTYVLERLDLWCPECTPKMLISTETNTNFFNIQEVVTIAKSWLNVQAGSNNFASYAGFKASALDYTLSGYAGLSQRLDLFRDGLLGPLESTGPNRGEVNFKRQEILEQIHSNFSRFFPQIVEDLGLEQGETFLLGVPPGLKNWRKTTVIAPAKTHPDPDQGGKSKRDSFGLHTTSSDRINAIVTKEYVERIRQLSISPKIRLERYSYCILPLPLFARFSKEGYYSTHVFLIENELSQDYIKELETIAKLHEQSTDIRDSNAIKAAYKTLAQL